MLKKKKQKPKNTYVDEVICVGGETEPQLFKEIMPDDKPSKW